MTPPPQIQPAKFGSLVREDLHGIPGPALPAAEAVLSQRPGDPQRQLDACLAALGAGEPKRALRLLDPSRQSARVTAALNAWVVQLDRNWYPGDVGAETELDPAVAYPGTRPGPPTEELLEQLVSHGPTGLLNARILLERWLRDGAQRGVQQAFGLAKDNLESLAGYADTHALPDIAVWTVLALADICHRARLPQADQLLEAARAQAGQLGDRGRHALSYLIEGDWYAAPGSSPEALGWDLAPQESVNPWPPADLGRAAACYDHAEALLGQAVLPRFRAALALRRAALQRSADPEAPRRHHLEESLAASRTAGDGAGVHLAAMHLLVADIDEGRLGQHTLDIGGGWHPPSHGPIAELLGWAETVGSRSWCVGLGRLLERCGGYWARRGSAPRSRIAYLAALQLISTDPGVPSQTLISAVANADARSNLATYALLRIERGFGPSLADMANVDEFAFAQKLDASLVIVSAARTLSRGTAAHVAGERLARLRDELAGAAAALEATLTPAAGPVPRTLEEMRTAFAAMRGDGSPQSLADASGRAFELMVRMQVRTARGVIGMLDVLSPLIRVEVAQRAGHTADADFWLQKAVDAARPPEIDAWLLPLALVTGKRLEEARAAISARANEIPDEFQFPLWLQAEDYENAAQALARLEAAGSLSSWHDLLSAAELRLARGEYDEARQLTRKAISVFENSIRLLLRDPERLDACNDPNVAGLYTTLSLTHLSPAAPATPAEVDASFEAAELARSLTSDAGLERVDPATRLSWENAAAEYSAVANRLLGKLANPRPDEMAAGFSALDELDGRLAALEHDIDQQDPGVLLRRTTPAPPARAEDLRRQMADGVLLLEYLAVGDDLLSWALTNDGLRPIRQTVSFRDLTGLVRAHHAGCVEGRAPASQLSSLLIEPFADLLRAHDRVIVVPFGPLNLVPFHALCLDGVPLGLTHVVSYVSRAAALLESGEGVDRPATAAHPLVVGDPAFEPAAHPRLNRLPGSAVEAAAVAGALRVAPDDVLIGDDATELAVIQRLEPCDLLHVSSHGHLDELSPFASSLVLAGRDELTVADIAGLRFGTDLAVLTGCDTGRGNATLGGDLVGLTRSLLRGGVDRAIVSLWPVDDAVAPIVMNHFYAVLGTGLAPAYALAQAQRALYAMSADELRSKFTELGGDPTALNRRRGLDLDPDLRDDEEIPAELGGDAERYWAPFVLVD
jgi:CHAT domain-containing protein/tetratricopeptide (TPR) repeat protein